MWVANCLQMVVLETTLDVDTGWSNLRADHVGLPVDLRPPQRDALFWLSKDYSVFICVGTGRKGMAFSLGSDKGNFLLLDQYYWYLLKPKVCK